MGTQFYLVATEPYDGLLEDPALALIGKRLENTWGAFPNGEVNLRVDRAGFRKRSGDSPLAILVGGAKDANDVMLVHMQAERLRRLGFKQIFYIWCTAGFQRADKDDGVFVRAFEPMARLMMAAHSFGGTNNMTLVHPHSDAVMTLLAENQRMPVEGVIPIAALKQGICRAIEGKQREGAPVVLLAADGGAVPMVKVVANQLGLEWGSYNKNRLSGTKVKLSAQATINVDGCYVVIIDDQISTAGTLKAASAKLYEAGAVDISAVATIVEDVQVCDDDGRVIHESSIQALLDHKRPGSKTKAAFRRVVGLDFHPEARSFAASYRGKRFVLQHALLSTLREAAREHNVSRIYEALPAPEEIPPGFADQR